MRQEYSVQIKGKDYALGQRTWLMGVLNVTPDSFSDGGLYFSKKNAVRRGLQLIEDGADILDVGGESSRPGSNPISAEEEKKRVLPVISEIRKHTDAFISVDTTKSEVLRSALDEGADILNDISGMRFDPKILEEASERDIPIVMMHMKGTPKNMQNKPWYKNTVDEIKAFLKKRVKTALNKGVKKNKIIIDPGIGFGKRLEDNLEIIRNLGSFNELDLPILIGVSRKSFLGSLLNTTPDQRIEGTIASSLISIVQGAHILRVHDVAPLKKAVVVADAIMIEKGKDKVLDAR
ncbi:MAG: dihydropteroate synthase [Candidatus Aminicenantes bacterium]|nr:dihydropteroate synthase [Candidatus Aminicenantes bacterium]